MELFLSLRYRKIAELPLSLALPSLPSPLHIPGPWGSGTASPDSSPWGQKLARLRPCPYCSFSPLQCLQPGRPVPAEAQGSPLGSLLGCGPLSVHTRLLPLKAT